MKIILQWAIFINFPFLKNYQKGKFPLVRNPHVSWWKITWKISKKLSPSRIPWNSPWKSLKKSPNPMPNLHEISSKFPLKPSQNAVALLSVHCVKSAAMGSTAWTLAERLGCMGKSHGKSGKPSIFPPSHWFFWTNLAVETSDCPCIGHFIIPTDYTFTGEMTMSFCCWKQSPCQAQLFVTHPDVFAMKFHGDGNPQEWVCLGWEFRWIFPEMSLWQFMNLSVGVMPKLIW